MPSATQTYFILLNWYEGIVKTTQAKIGTHPIYRMLWKSGLPGDKTYGKGTQKRI
jgi:hypothetical protein